MEENHLKINEKKDRMSLEDKNYYKRIKNGNSFKYVTKDNKPITNQETLDEIKKIYIAPAYKNVKIFLGQDLLAVGIDTKGRKQYVYSNSFKKKRENKKYCQLMVLSNRIDKLKKQINQDIKKDEYDKMKLVATVLKIMDLCNFRSGQRKMEKAYKSHGITTVHKKHIKISNKKVEIEFTGKKGVNNYCEIYDEEVKSLVKKIYQLSTNNDPYLFSIKNEDKDHVHVTIDDLNDYLRPFEVTSKDLRTWNANIIFLKNMLCEMDDKYDEYKNMKNPTDNKKLKFRKLMVREAVKKTAEQLHNTPTVCRSSYIYKNILQGFEQDDNMLERFDEYDKKNGNKKMMYENYLSLLLSEIRNKNHCKK